MTLLNAGASQAALAAGRARRHRRDRVRPARPPAPDAGREPGRGPPSRRRRPAAARRRRTGRRGLRLRRHPGQHRAHARLRRPRPRRSRPRSPCSCTTPRPPAACSWPRRPRRRPPCWTTLRAQGLPAALIGEVVGGRERSHRRVPGPFGINLAGYGGPVSTRPAAIWSAAARLPARRSSSRRCWPARPRAAEPRPPRGAARGRGRACPGCAGATCPPPATPDAVAAGRPGLGRQPGRLRGAPADLPGRRLAHAELRRPGPVRPHQRRLRRLPRRPAGRHRRQRPRPARAGDATTSSSTTTRTGACCPGRSRAAPPRSAPAPRWRWPAGPATWPPTCRPRPGHRGGAGPLPADRGGPRHARIRRTGPATRHRRRRTRHHRGGASRGHHAPGHRARARTTKPPHLQLALVDGPGLLLRPAQRGLHPAAGPGRAHRPDPDRARLAGGPESASTGRRGRRAASPAATGARSPPRSRPLTGRDTAEQVWRATHNEFFWAYALADAAVLAAIGLASWGAAPEQRRRRARVVAGGRGVRRRGARGHVPGQPGALVDDRAPGRLRCTASRWRWPWSSRWPRCSAAAAAVRSRRSALICLFTVAVLGVDVMTGSPAAAGDAVRPVGARGRPVLRHRQRGAGHLRPVRAVRRGLAGAGAAAPACSPGRLRRRAALAAARGPGRRGGRDLRGVRVGLARVRRQGGRHHRHGALLPAAGPGDRRGQAELAPDACSSRSAGWPCSPCSR